jgi:hypothetical protein
MRRPYARLVAKTCAFCMAVLFIALPIIGTGGRLAAQQQPEIPPPGQALAPNQIDDLVAPIALYPDPLLSQILVACTYPLELVQVSQWLQRNRGLSGPALTQAAQQQNWDPSIQALVVFPDLVRQLNQDITWTTNLGNAFLSQQADVMEAVQQMRLRAQQAGKLSSTSQQTVTTNNGSGQPVIVIEPANPQVVYLPEYNPLDIWGASLYYPYPGWYYPPFGGGVYFGFGPGISMGLFFGGWGGWGGWGWNPGWGGRNIIVNNNFIHRNNFNARGGGSLSGTSQWTHDAAHRGGVPYSSAALSSRYGATARQNLQARASSQVRQATGGQSRGAAQQGAARTANPEAGAQRMGSRQIAPSAPAANRSAFGGVRQGAAARTQSDHGYSSLGAARSAGGGGARMGGGGGGGNRGGGGRR